MKRLEDLLKTTFAARKPVVGAVLVPPQQTERISYLGPYDPPLVVTAKNSTGYSLLVETALALTSNQSPFTEVLINLLPVGPNPLQQELDQTKAVLGDLLKEKLTGIKVYSVRRTGVVPLFHVHLSLESAKALVHEQEGRELPWEKHDSYRVWWASEFWVVEEHELAALK